MKTCPRSSVSYSGETVSFPWEGELISCRCLQKQGD